MSTVAPPRQVKDSRSSEPRSAGQKLGSMLIWTLVSLGGAGALAFIATASLIGSQEYRLLAGCLRG